MAAIEVSKKFPNVLLVTGEEVYVDGYRDQLKNSLYDATKAAASPVRKGTHDFWVTYAVPFRTDASDSVSWIPGNAAASSERPLRGIVSMGLPGDTKTATVREHLYVLLQEVAHHWLVPADLQIKTAAGTLGLPEDFQVTQQMRDGTKLSGPPLLGRSSQHWSAYWQASASPLDGVSYASVGTENSYQKWHAEPNVPAMPVTPSGLPATDIGGRLGPYNDLDLMLMGVMTPTEAYAAVGNAFRWIEPRLTAPLAYQVGVFVAFAKDDFLFFGFHRDHGQLVVQRTGKPNMAPVDIGSDYHPLQAEGIGMALRVVRRGDDFYFQARYDDGPGSGSGLDLVSHAWRELGSLLGWERLQTVFRLGPWVRLASVVERLPFFTSHRRGNLFEDLDALAPVDPMADFERFRTVAVVNENRRPLALGAIVKTWESVLAEGSFRDLELLYEEPGFTPSEPEEVAKAATTVHRVLKTDVVPPPLPVAYDALPSGKLWSQVPIAGPTITTAGGRIRITVPFGVPDMATKSLSFPEGAFNHWVGIDNAPKLVTRAPAADFAFATAAKVRRSAFPPWSGLSVVDVDATVWGREKSAKTTDVVVPATVTANQPPPPSGAYKTAFVVVAKNRSDITDAMIERVDIIRRYWDAAFNAATRTRRSSDSTL